MSEPEMSVEQFVLQMDEMHQPLPGGHACQTCEVAQGWPCITRVLLDSTMWKGSDVQLPDPQ